MFWLAAIVFLPFPTALIADGIDGGFAALYIGTLLAVSLLSLLIANYLARHPELTDGDAAVEGRQHVIASAFSVGAILIALIISLFSPIIGLFGLLLLIPAQVIAARGTVPERSTPRWSQPHQLRIGSSTQRRGMTCRRMWAP
jgi:TMEM175 potassium channel family protein